MIGRFFESFTKLMFQMGRHTSISGPSSVTQWIVHYTMLVSRRWYFLVAVSLLLQAAFSSSSSLTTTVRYRPQRLYRAPSRTRTISLRLPRLVGADAGGFFGDPNATNYLPKFCDPQLFQEHVWFWEPNLAVRTLAELIPIYHDIVGRNMVTKWSCKGRKVGFI